MQCNKCQFVLTPLMPLPTAARRDLRQNDVINFFDWLSSSGNKSSSRASRSLSCSLSLFRALQARLVGKSNFPAAEYLNTNVSYKLKCKCTLQKANKRLVCTMQCNKWQFDLTTPMPSPTTVLRNSRQNQVI